MADRPTSTDRLLRLAPLLLALLFLATRLPLLTIGWREGEATFLLATDGDLLARAGRWLAWLRGEPVGVPHARTWALALGACGVGSWLLMLLRLVGRRTGPAAAAVAGLFLVASPFLEGWLTDASRLGDLLGLAALGLAGERVLTHKLRGGSWRLAMATLGTVTATLASTTAWATGPTVVLLALLAFPNPASPQAGERRRRGRRAAAVLLGVWVLALALAPGRSSASTEALAALALVLPALLARSSSLPVRLRTGLGLALLALGWVLALEVPGVVGPVAFLGLLLALPMVMPVRRGIGALGAVHGVVLALSLLPLAFGTLLARWDLRWWDGTTRRTTVALEEAALAEARTDRNSATFVLDPDRWLPDDLPALLQPPFRAGRVPVVLLREHDGLAEALADQDPAELARRSLVVVTFDGSDVLEPRPYLRVARGWAGADDPAAGLVASPDPDGSWSFDPPVPQHAFGAVRLELPSAGLVGRLTAWTGDGLAAPTELQSFDLDLPATGPGLRIVLPVAGGDARLLGAPLVRLTFEGAVLASPPQLVPALPPPSLLLPGADHVLDLSGPPPALQAWYEPSLLRPHAFRLDVELTTDAGLFDLSTGGVVPPGAPGDLRLTPTWLDRTDRCRGPLPSLDSLPWDEFLDRGLLRSIRLSGPGSEGRWRLRLYWAGGLEAGSTPWAPIGWVTQAGAEAGPGS